MLTAIPPEWTVYGYGLALVMLQYLACFLAKSVFRVLGNGPLAKGDGWQFTTITGGGSRALLSLGDLGW